MTRADRHDAGNENNSRDLETAVAAVLSCETGEARQKLEVELDGMLLAAEQNATQVDELSQTQKIEPKVVRGMVENEGRGDCVPNVLSEHLKRCGTMLTAGLPPMRVREMIADALLDDPCYEMLWDHRSPDDRESHDYNQYVEHVRCGGMPLSGLEWHAAATTFAFPIFLVCGLRNANEYPECWVFGRQQSGSPLIVDVQQASGGSSAAGGPLFHDSYCDLLGIDDSKRTGVRDAMVRAQAAKPRGWNC